MIILLIVLHIILNVTKTVLLWCLLRHFYFFSFYYALFQWRPFGHPQKYREPGMSKWSFYRLYVFRSYDQPETVRQWIWRGERSFHRLSDYPRFFWMVNFWIPWNQQFFGNRWLCKLKLWTKEVIVRRFFLSILICILPFFWTENLTTKGSMNRRSLPFFCIVLYKKAPA